MSAVRTFAALLSHDGVCLVEYSAERSGIRVLEQWFDPGRSSSIDDVLDRLASLLSARGAQRPKLAVTIEQFGVFHHVMTLPGAGDDVLRPIIRRELQRVFGVTDPAFSFTRGGQNERRDPARADARTAPTQLFVAGAPRETIDAIQQRLASERVDVDIVTVMPKAMHSLYQGVGTSLEPTAVVVCLESGPHLAFCLDGRLELATDPPIALEGERAPAAVVLDEVERGAVYFRQQFRGATATRMLLSARQRDYDALAAGLEERFHARVWPLFAGAGTPEAAVAIGAVLESLQPAPLDLYPHPPRFAERAGAALRGPNAFVAALATVAVVAGIWCDVQLLSLGSARRESAALRSRVQSGVPALEPMRRIAERRADYTREVEFVANTNAERRALAATLQAVARHAPAGVRFDSLSLSRTGTGWAGGIVGDATGLTAGQAVRELDAFFRSVRGESSVSAATLDEFDYPAVARPDSARASASPVVIRFRLSFAVAREAGGAR